MRNSGIDLLRAMCTVEDLYVTEGSGNTMLELKVETQKGEKDAN